VLVANLTRPGINGVSVRVVGIRLGLQFSKTDDNHVNANGENCAAVAQDCDQKNNLGDFYPSVKR
jgi:hypothetical protein